MKKLSILIICCFVLVGCKTDQKLTFSYYEIIPDDCNGCAKVTLNLPKATPESEVSNHINDAIDGLIIDFLNFSETDNPANLNEAIALFEKSYAEMQAEYASSLDWEFTADGEITYENPNLICTEISSYIFTGGAHGYGAVSFLLFDPDTGNLLDSEAVFSDLEGFKKLAEQKFREQHNIAPDADINSTGFMFEKNIFTLPENIGFDDDQVILIYNQYEIASYASGQILVEIPLNEVTPFMDAGLL